jgi:RNA polymerase sigma factor for flagellar operon FliA
MHRAAARYATDGDSALVARHAGLIDRLARRIAGRTGGAIAPDDLWSAGAMGLLEAARRFDASREVRFESFAEHRIRGAMIDELRRMDHLPRRLRDQAEKVERVQARLGQELKREPTADELSAELGVGCEELASLCSVMQPHVAVLETLQAPIVPSDEQVERAQQLRALTAAISALPERLQIVLSLHYTEGLTYREIAKILDVSEPRVCQIHGEAIARLQEEMGGASR